MRYSRAEAICLRGPGGGLLYILRPAQQEAFRSRGRRLFSSLHADMHSRDDHQAHTIFFRSTGKTETPYAIVHGVRPSGRGKWAFRPRGEFMSPDCAGGSAWSRQDRADTQYHPPASYLPASAPLTACSGTVRSSPRRNLVTWWALCLANALARSHRRQFALTAAVRRLGRADIASGGQFNGQHTFDLQQEAGPGRYPP